MSGDWRPVRAGGVTVEVPAETPEPSSEGFEQGVMTVDGPGFRLILDCSPFADPLSGYASQPDFRRERDDIDGRPTDVVSFQSPDGTRVVAARLADRLTAVVHAGPEVDPGIARRVLRSIRTDGMETHHG